MQPIFVCYISVSSIITQSCALCRVSLVRDVRMVDTSTEVMNDGTRSLQTRLFSSYFSGVWVNTVTFDRSERLEHALLESTIQRSTVKKVSISLRLKWVSVTHIHKHNTLPPVHVEQSLDHHTLQDQNTVTDTVHYISIHK